MNKYFSILITFSLLLFYYIPGPDIKADVKSDYTVDITTATKTKITTPGFRRHTYSTSSNFKVVDPKVPTVVEIDLFNIEINQGAYRFTVPFEIIKDIKYHYSNEEQKLIGTVTLADNSTIVGRTWGTFIIKTDLGQTKMDAADIQKIVFHHTPKSTYNFKPNGKHSLILHKKDGSTKIVKGATFIKDKYNVNHCIIGDEYPDSFSFESEGNRYNINWNKIRYLMPAKEHFAGTSKFAPLKMITRENKEYQGRGSIWAGSVRHIEGVLKYSAVYKLRVLVSIDAIYDVDKYIFSKIEFK